MISLRPTSMMIYHRLWKIEVIYEQYRSFSFMLQVSQSTVQTLILPKIHSYQDLDYVSDAISSLNRDLSQGPNLQIVPSIESARGIWNLGSIAGWKSNHSNPQVGGELSAILVRFFMFAYWRRKPKRSLIRKFAAEDCEPFIVCLFILGWTSQIIRLCGHIHHPYQLTSGAVVYPLSNSHCCKSFWTWFNRYGLLAAW